MMYYILFGLITVFLSGCINLEEVGASPKQKKEIHIIKLNKEVKELDSHDKRLIYKSIKNEIKLHRKKGDEAYRHGYYHDAINAYELVNFYEGYQAIPVKKINDMKTEAQKRASIHYKKAKYYLPKEKKKALIELNAVMMNNPEYKDSKELYSSLKNERDMKIYIHALENSLETQLINHKGSYNELKSIKKNLNHLAQYDYKNKSIQKSRKLLEKQKDILLKSTITTYHQGKLKKAKAQFLEILSIYPDDARIQKYIREISFKQSKEQNLYLAKEMLKENKYLQSIRYAQKVLQLEPDNKEAKKIIANAKQKANIAVENYVKDGKYYYNNKNLDRAKECFESALKIDKTNNTALIYHKKIQRQLQTIKSLQ